VAVRSNGNFDGLRRSCEGPEQRTRREIDTYLTAARYACAGSRRLSARHDGVLGNEGWGGRPLSV